MELDRIYRCIKVGNISNTTILYIESRIYKRRDKQTLLVPHVSRYFANKSSARYKIAFRRIYEETRKKRRDCDTVEQFGSVFRRSAVICLPTASPGVSSATIPLLLALYLSLSLSLFDLLPRLLTRGALPTCQRYIFCRPTNRLAGNFEIGTLI